MVKLSSQWREARHVKQYTWQRLNRHRKPQEPIKKLKEAEFVYILEGKFYGGAEIL